MRGKDYSEGEKREENKKGEEGKHDGEELRM